MKAPGKVVFPFLLLLFISVLASSFVNESQLYKISFPYKQAGLTERQAAAHLLSRFTYGAKPSDVDVVVEEGLPNWFQRQLEGDIEDKGLDSMLTPYQDIYLNNNEVENKYPRQPKVLRMAIKDGFVNKDSVGKGDPKLYKQQLQDYRLSKGYGQEQDLIRQFMHIQTISCTNC
jgi:hypothetical protein